MLNHGNMICALLRHNVALPASSARRGSDPRTPTDTKINSTFSVFYPRRTAVETFARRKQKSRSLRERDAVWEASQFCECLFLTS